VENILDTTDFQIMIYLDQHIILQENKMVIL
jgi:hypothetical protein